MKAGLLKLLLMIPPLVRDQPLPPARSPDLQILATTRVPEAFVTPEGGNYSLWLNGHRAYPRAGKRRWFAGYNSWHTFLSELVWSPDSRRLALVEEIYDWEYIDPFNRYFEGRATNKGLYLTIVSREGKAAVYLLTDVSPPFELRWRENDKLVLNGRAFDLRAKPPRPIL